MIGCSIFVLLLQKDNQTSAGEARGRCCERLVLLMVGSDEPHEAAVTGSEGLSERFLVRYYYHCYSCHRRLSCGVSGCGCVCVWVRTADHPEMPAGRLVLQLHCLAVRPVLLAVAAAVVVAAIAVWRHGLARRRKYRLGLARTSGWRSAGRLVEGWRRYDNVSPALRPHGPAQTSSERIG